MSCCADCSSVTAMFECLSCQTSLCLPCKERHQRHPDSHRHPLVVLSGVRVGSSRPNLKRCASHSIKMDLFCTVCDRSVCYMCKLEHADHPFTTVKQLTAPSRRNPVSLEVVKRQSSEFISSGDEFVQESGYSSRNSSPSSPPSLSSLVDQFSVLEAASRDSSATCDTIGGQPGGDDLQDTTFAGDELHFHEDHYGNFSPQRRTETNAQQPNANVTSERSREPTDFTSTEAEPEHRSTDASFTIRNREHSISSNDESVLSCTSSYEFIPDSAIHRVRPHRPLSPVVVVVRHVTQRSSQYSTDYSSSSSTAAEDRWRDCLTPTNSIREVSDSSDGIPATLGLELIRTLRTRGAVRSEVMATGLSVGPKGELLVADMGADLVQVFSPDGALLTDLTTFPMDRPSQAVFLDEATIAVCCECGIKLFSQAGDFEDKLNVQLESGRALSVHHATPLALSPNAGPHSFFDCSESLTSSTDSSEDANSSCNGVCEEDGSSSLVISDVTAHGAVIHQWHNNRRGFIVGGLRAPAFRNPWFMCAVNNGDVIVSDRADHRVKVFSRRGFLLLEVGQSGSLPGEFRMPAGLVLDRHGRLLVADTGNHRVQRFDAEFSFESVLLDATSDGLRYPTGIAMYGHDRLHVLQANGDVKTFAYLE